MSKIMTKEQLFEKYSVNESHNVWDNSIDNWMSVEIYRVMHDGNLPSQGDETTKWVIDFLGEAKKLSNFWRKEIMTRKDWGSLYLTSKRMVYRFSENILFELNS